MIEDKGLNVEELLRGTYEKLGERNLARNIGCPDKVFTEIADDSDWHRTRRGFMAQQSCFL